MNRTRLFAYAFGLAASLTLACVAQLAAPGFYAIASFTVDGGGGTSTGGAFTMSGTIGQPDAGATLSGGGFTLQGGFWAGGGSQPIDTCLPDIAPLPSGDGLVNVTDLLAVIGAWGACGNPANCPADISPAGPPVGDDVVNVADLLAVIGGWGTCP